MQLNDQYQLILAKSDLMSHVSLADLVHLTKGRGEETSMIPYKPEPLNDHGEFGFRLAPLQPVNKIILTYSGSKAETLIANDSVVHYHLSCSNISIRYAADSPVDIYLTSGGQWDNENLRLDILLVRRHNEIYFLFIAPINYKNVVKSINLGELLKNYVQKPLRLTAKRISETSNLQK